MLCVILLSVIGLMGPPLDLHTPPRARVERSALRYGSMPSGGSAAASDRHCAQCFTPLYRCSRYASLLTQNTFPCVVNAALVVAPFEEELSAGATSLFKRTRYGIRRTLRFLRWSANRWAQWMLRALGFFILAVLAPLLNLDLLATWREKGWHGVRDSVLLGGAVYMRLLFDHHAPFFGKVAIAFALAYGVASRDLVPDASFPLGALDDALAVVLASRTFMLLCPESLVETHAILAARGGERRRAWQRSSLRPPVG